MKISGVQIFWIMFTFVSGNMLITTMGTAIRDVKQDAWISYLIAIIFGVLIVFVATKVSLLYPNQTLIEYSKTILGKWIGNIVVITYLFQWYSVIGYNLRQFADFTITLLLPTTPLWALILTMLLLVIYVTAGGGIEGIGRCSEVFGIILVFSGVITFILVVPNLDFSKILPLYSDSGLRPILKGTLYLDSYLGESVMMMMFVSFMAQPKQGPSRAIWGVALSGLALCASSMVVLMTLGPEVAEKLKYPVIDAIGFISVMGFIQNVDLLVLLIWILSSFIINSVYFFMASYGTAQWLKIKEWRKTIWFVAAFSFVYALLFPNVTITEVEYINKYWIPFVFPVNIIGIPLLLWIVGSIRKKKL
ncbi:GerAB/ArcD/ProY family transporter [Bacillus cihuensis]|uniref:GerAB/ArcD/ProY family transporter n=1 Tax=Bacillus cihuensis TaxID=1208599 RepID=UPI0003FB3601|nr:endospore germination permease [Bacillus cihuensis]